MYGSKLAGKLNMRKCPPVGTGTILVKTGLVQPDVWEGLFVNDVSPLTRADQFPVREAHGMKWPIDGLLPELNEPEEAGIVRRQIIVLPDKGVEYPLMIRHSVDHFGGGKPVPLEHQPHFSQWCSHHYALSSSATVSICYIVLLHRYQIASLLSASATQDFVGPATQLLGQDRVILPPPFARP